MGKLAAVDSTNSHQATGKLSDEQLMLQAQEGQTERFAELIARHREAMVRAARHRLGDETLAEDAVQEAWMAAYRYRHTYKPQYRLRTWLWTLLMNQCRTVWLRRQRDPAATRSIDGPQANSAAHSRVSQQGLTEESLPSTSFSGRVSSGQVSSGQVSSGQVSLEKAAPRIVSPGEPTSGDRSDDRPDQEGAHSAFQQADWIVDKRALTPEEPVLAAERRVLLEQLLDRLPREQGQALRLRFFEGLKFQQIADQTGCSLATAKHRVRVGLERLAQAVRTRRGVAESL